MKFYLVLNNFVVLLLLRISLRLRISLVEEGGLILSSDNPLDFHVKIWPLVLLTVIKYLYFA